MPVDFGRLRHPKRDMVWVALAGPGSNFVQALFWAAALYVMSGTGTEGATLRVYLERYEPVGGRLAEATPDMLAELITAAEAIAGITRHTGRTAPDVVT